MSDHVFMTTGVTGKPSRPRDRVIELVTGEKFTSDDNWQTARDERGRLVSKKRLLQLQLLQAHGAAG